MFFHFFFFIRFSPPFLSSSFLFLSRLFWQLFNLFEQNLIFDWDAPVQTHKEERQKIQAQTFNLTVCIRGLIVFFLLISSVGFQYWYPYCILIAFDKFFYSKVMHLKKRRFERRTFRLYLAGVLLSCSSGIFIYWKNYFFVKLFLNMCLLWIPSADFSSVLLANNIHWTFFCGLNFFATRLNCKVLLSLQVFSFKWLVDSGYL